MSAARQPHIITQLLKNKLTNNDVRVLFIVLPYYFVLGFIIWGKTYIYDLHIFLITIMVTLVIWPSSWYIHSNVGYVIRSFFPEISQTTRRVLVTLAVFIPITIFINYLVLLLCCELAGVPYKSDKFMEMTIAGLILNMLATAVFESTFLLKRWKTSVLEAEDLKKAYLQSELDNLKSQVNPHFLFNSLNSLSALITEDAEKAEQFLREMSRVYRYLLQNNERELTPVEVELTFVRSYYHLLKTRYESAIQLDIHISDEYLDYLIPPLTLQMLIENAVKHNTLMETHPLIIELYSDQDGQLVVSNNLQPKAGVIESNKIGLKNIQKKYQLLVQQELIIDISDRLFTVKLPLIKPAKYEDSHH
ncbi:histidine kinase [Chitinophaga sp.]|uniref:sensor histidine kinase n=1 Tax=Chitinophaga sp. TaxID=1869181 RepID=UPI0025C14606|nr:histidine kinase [Chitinophaga sp.]